MAKRPVEYCNNAALYKAMVTYRQECAESVASGKGVRPKTKTYDYIGQCILKIAQKLSNAPNFIGYSWRSEMISDAYTDCVRGLESFNPDKSKNPFAYFTQICYHAMVQRIKKENKQRDIKSEIIKNSGVIDELSSFNQDKDNAADMSGFVSYLLESVDKPKEKLEKSKKRTTKAYQIWLKEKEEAIKTFESITSTKKTPEIEVDNTLEIG